MKVTLWRSGEGKIKSAAPLLHTIHEVDIPSSLGNKTKKRSTYPVTWGFRHNACTQERSVTDILTLCAFLSCNYLAPWWCFSETLVRTLKWHRKWNKLQYRISGLLWITSKIQLTSNCLSPEIWEQQEIIWQRHCLQQCRQLLSLNLSAQFSGNFFIFIQVSLLPTSQHMLKPLRNRYKKQRQGKFLCILSEDEKGIQRLSCRDKLHTTTSGDQDFSFC